MTSANARATAAKPQAAGQTHRPRAAATLLPRRPYPGLRPFEKAEWPIFRGRDRLIQDILTILAENHFVSIIGPSGSGKSSLVRAGVLATLERRHSRMGVRWRTGTMRPGASPLWSMADGILRALRPEIVAADGELPAAEVAQAPGPDRRERRRSRHGGTGGRARGRRKLSAAGRPVRGDLPLPGRSRGPRADTPDRSPARGSQPQAARASTSSPRCAPSTSVTARASRVWPRH